MASERVREYWRGQVSAEYHSCAVTQHLGLWLTQLGASPDLLRRSWRIADDELRHAQEAWGVARDAGVQNLLELDEGSLCYQRAHATLCEDAVAACLETFCVGETAAVRLLALMRHTASEPRVTAFFESALRDEVVHRDFGWTCLEALLNDSRWPQLLDFAQAQVLDSVMRHRKQYLGAKQTRVRSEEELRWGLCPQSEIASVLDRVWLEELIGRFAQIGLRLPAPADVLNPLT